ncbi:putative copper resistance protein D [Tamaricihabitans halophyticus]|uniref:Putative copper resistance protein D n=1 Tax=Tamaricihabitans halophyticus TaxID=1262583 RepID=A0A4R2QH14_9PSEU|nr:cytochrome c oxidase assembly protein [Tamaricihabitans halophyticus]TCP48533.1 putative copper resistance protein D [Tamaricihabitans halophyticus]
MPRSPATTTDRAPILPVILIGTLLAALVAAGLVAMTGGAAAVIPGLGDPGAVTKYGVTVVRLIAEVASVVTIGSLLLAAFFVPPQRSGTLGADGYAAVRTAGFAAAIWCVGALASVVFTAAEAAGRPVSEVLDTQVLFELVDAIEQAKAWGYTAAIALIVAIGCWVVLSWGWTVVLFGASLAGMLPVGLAGHSASGGAHDVATNSLLFHLVGAALWVGGLIAVLVVGARKSSHLSLAVQRFSRLALVCWAVMAVSGVVNALVRVPLGDLLGTEYGLLVLVKLAALIVLGAFGHQQRNRSVRAVVERADGRGLLRLGGVEVLVMLVTIGIAAALSRTPPPTEVTGQVSTTELLIGYELDGAPTALRLLFDWRFDLIFGTAAVALGVLYLLGVRRLRKRGDAWPVGRTVAWLSGCATLLIATSSGIGRYAPAMFSVHMSGHMMLSMAVPVLLVLGGPVTLALRALPVAGKGNPPGPREWLLAAVHSPISRVLTNPVVALVLFVGSFYLLYFSGLFDSVVSEHAAHLAMNAHFILSGYVFFWPVIGVDQAPRRLPPLGRLGLMLAATPFHAFFGVILMNMQTVIGENFYRGLDLPWAGDLLNDQRTGGGIAWAFGELPVVLVLIALLVQWSRADERAARRRDRRTEHTGDAELEAYNAMLRRLSEPSGAARTTESADSLEGSPESTDGRENPNRE